MWLMMPKGCESISVALQNFCAEITDDEGRAYFRVPDHFAPTILAIGGFNIATPPAGAPEDLPKADPERDGAIVLLTGTVEAQKRDIQGLSEDLHGAIARITGLANENTDLKEKLTAAELKVEELTERLEDASKDATIVPVATKKAG